MKFKKILVYNIDKATNLDSLSWNKIESLGSRMVFIPQGNPKLKKELADTDCVLINFGTEFGKAEIDAAPQLKYIGVMATAFGKIDTYYTKKKKIIVSNLKGYSTESVAEFVLAAILEHARRLEEGKIRGRESNYSEVGIKALELKDKIFGIVGLGTIGQRVAEIALGFGADVRYWSRNRKKDAEKRGIQYERFDGLIKNADILSINLAQAKETERIFNESIFKKLKKGSVIINTAPMELIDIDGLAKRLKDRDITFILDHSDEMAKEDLKKLAKYSNCIIYPPIAYVSQEAAENKKRIFIGNIEGFLKRKPINVVNP